jgi:hypothetical protein
VKHAGPESLARLAPLLERVRALGRLTERKPGSFYLRSSAFLHFHEDPAGLFADLKADGKAFTRLPVNSRKEQDALVAQVQRTIGAAITPR